MADDLITKEDCSNTKTSYAYNENNSLQHTFIRCETNLQPRIRRLPKRKQNLMKQKSYCGHICSAIPLVFKNFKLKMCDHLLLGGEHTQKISPGYNSPIIANTENVSSEEKKEIVKSSPSFGMFSLFKYHNR